jgi:hypothetical protein
MLTATQHHCSLLLRLIALQVWQMLLLLLYNPYADYSIHGFLTDHGVLQPVVAVQGTCVFCLLLGHHSSLAACTH